MSLPVGSLLRFRASFKKDGKVFAATSVTASVLTPSGKTITLTQSSGIIKESTGNYAFEMVCDRRGVYEVTWSSVAFKEERTESTRYAVGVADEEAQKPAPAPKVGIPIGPPPPAMKVVRADRAEMQPLRIDRGRSSRHELVAPKVTPASAQRTAMVTVLSKNGVGVHPSKSDAWVTSEYKKLMGRRRA